MAQRYIIKDRLKEFEAKGYKKVENHDYKDMGLNQSATKNVIEHGDLILVKKVEVEVQKKSKSK